MSVTLPLVITEQRGCVAILTLNRPPVNAIGAALRRALAGSLAEAIDRRDVAAIVLTGAGMHFSAGADIREFADAPDAGVPSLADIVERIESAPKPVIAAIRGTATGGALELAMGCAYRVGAAESEMGLPEVTLGFVPGAGGTIRLPRLVGVERALEMILTGRRIGGKEAVSCGLLDELAPLADLLPRALALAERASRSPVRRTRDLPVPDVPAGLFERAEAELSKTTRGRQAPAAAIACVRRAVELPFAEALRLERDAFLAMVRGPESTALRYLFFAERQAQKAGNLGNAASIPAIRRVGVVGFGTMGSGIAISFAAAGFPVVVVDETPEAVVRGLAKVRGTFEEARDKGRISASECNDRIARVRGGTEYRDLAGSDLVIEAAFEEMDVKQAVFARLGSVCGENAILATNTSSLDVNVIAAATRNPSRVVGMHFFSPANVMKLVELVRPDRVSPAVLAASLDAVKRIGKIGVVVGVGEGFVGNRMLFAYRRQADFLLEEGAVPHQVDAALRDFGMAMGPFQTADVAGLDISWRIRRRLAATRPSALRYSPIADRLCEMGRLGQKTGAGWYRYEQGSRRPIPDPEVDALVRSISAELGFTRREVTDAEIVERCLSALVNEGAAILDEGLAARPGDVDVIWVYGYGFPRHRGGPMHWANTFGLDRILDAVERMHADQGSLVQPSALLRRLVHDRQPFDASAAPPSVGAPR
jgi:3-hydroxyacyl-CoA dehydrogenase